MRIFNKLLMFFSAIGLLPLAALSVVTVQATRDLGAEVGGHAAEVLIEAAKQDLRHAVTNYAAIVHREAQVLELALQWQARAIETYLREKPEGLGRAFFSEDLDGGLHIPEGMVESSRHYRPDAEDRQVALRIALGAADIRLAPGVERGRVEEDTARLSRMTPVYQEIWARYSEMLVWLMTALESGVMSGYPGVGGYPDSYDPRTRPWYVQAREKGCLTWNAPYVDAIGRVVVGSLSMPVYGPNGDFAGVAAMDIRNIRAFPAASWNAVWGAEVEVLLTVPRLRAGSRMPDLTVIGKSERREKSPDWRAAPAEEVLEFHGSHPYDMMVTDILAGSAGVMQLPYRDKDAIWAYGPVGQSGAALVLIVPEAAVARQASNLTASIAGKTDAYLKGILMVALLTLSAVAAVTYVLSRAIADPLRSLAEATGGVAAGDLDSGLPPIRAGGEIGDLARSVEAMKRDLKAYIRRLTEATAARERMDSELKIARRIQMSFLPRRFPGPPDKTGYDLHALLIPAREVGGDFFDFFALDDTRLFFAVGDVSGKGVPAALYMALTQSLMKGIARGNAVPSDVLARMNERLCRDNDEHMFVSVFCGVLDGVTGEVVFSNAGHIPPVLLGGRGRAAFLQTRSALVLGGFGSTRYTTERLQLAPGHGLFLYTDGVTEARCGTGALFGRRRLLERMTALAGHPPRDAIRKLTETGRAFCGDLPQADDIAMMMIRFNGRG